MKTIKTLGQWVLVLTLVLFFSNPAFSKIYKWKDDQGRSHITDDIRKVPPAYRKQLNKQRHQKLQKKMEQKEKEILPVLPSAIKDLHPEAGQGLGWPIRCVPGHNCSIGFPDVDKDGRTGYGKKPGYLGHEGTDIGISWEQMDRGVSVYAAADGIVKFVFDDPNRFDRCQSKDTHPDCRFPEGTDVTTGSGPYCKTGEAKYGQCSWGFGGGNVVIILHPKLKNVFGTRYDHFKSGSIIVRPGQKVKKGDVIGQVGSAGRSSGPHLHFEVWGPGGYYGHGPVVDPWDGSGVPGNPGPLWEHNPPWKK